ncbi:MAG: hypothetical protein JW840_01195 [Candidatus Thermoplasmatota archaeon]|nr:hypothetical protein [Candidatus Thermoplasmatota archaeon]
MTTKGFCSVLILIIVILSTISASVLSSDLQASSSKQTGEDGWYYLPAYPNYAPNGLPDFSQKQDTWKQRQSIWLFIGGLWSFCAPTSLADIFWWFDSKHEDPLGYPGDGNDTYPLVKNCNTIGAPTPGPMQDDHNFNNVNDVESRWRQGRGAKELIETLAWYCNTNFCRFPFVRGVPGTLACSLEKGAKQWIQQAGLQDHYTVEGIWNPEFSFIVDHVQNNSGVIVNLLLYNSHAVVFQTFLGHYVAIAGINRNGFIALSDPFQNEANPSPTPLEHNDASVVSYDVFSVNFTSPFPGKASWWIEEYFDFGITRFGGLGWYALIISEVD